MDHFARPDDELARAQAARTLWRDFQGYTTQRARATIAVGVSAISDVGDAYAQNEHALGHYEAAIADGRLATVKGIWLERRRSPPPRGDHAAHVQRLGRPRQRRRAATSRASSRRWPAPNATAWSASRGREIVLTALGRTFVRNVAMVFDAYLAPPDGRRVFSATV